MCLCFCNLEQKHYTLSRNMCKYCLVFCTKDRLLPPHVDHSCHLELSKLDALCSQMLYRTVVRFRTYTAEVPTYNSFCTQLSSQNCISFLPKHCTIWYSQAYSSELHLIYYCQQTMITLAISSVANLQYSSPHLLQIKTMHVQK